MISVILVEAVAGGLVTTMVFTAMMRATEKAVGATHYTSLTAVDLLGKTLMTTASGFVAAYGGYRSLFFLGTAVG